MVTGYLSPGYAESLSEFGIPRELPRCAGWILQRRIPGFGCEDATGCYPLFACQEWGQLHADVESLSGDLVSLALVTDPFGECDVECLRACFGDRVMPFKEHFVVDLSRPVQDYVHPHHRRHAQRALGEIHVERCTDPTRLLDEWTDLYRVLIERHRITGMPAFSRESFAKQLAVPGMVAFRAEQAGATDSMLLWYVQNDVAYYHLGASSPRGYELCASFALFWSAIAHFAADGLRWLDLGAGAGVEADGADGLTRFKRGWSTGTRTAYFCGRIFDHQKYAEITKARGVGATDYFPAYRKDEFL